MSSFVTPLKDEAMTPAERVRTVIDLKVPDRVPVFPIIDTIPCKLAGITTKEWMFNPEKAHYALKKAFEFFGGWDHLEFVGGTGGAVPNPYPTIGSPIYQRSLMPGLGLDENSQSIIAHEEIMSFGDKEFLCVVCAAIIDVQNLMNYTVWQRF